MEIKIGNRFKNITITEWIWLPRLIFEQVGKLSYEDACLMIEGMGWPLIFDGIEADQPTKIYGLAGHSFQMADCFWSELIDPQAHRWEQVFVQDYNWQAPVVKSSIRQFVFFKRECK